MELTIKLLALLSLPISLVSVWIAFTTRNVAKRALELNKVIYNDRQSRFEIYLVAARYQLDKSNNRIILLHTSLKNLSDTKNSFFCTLEFEYILPNGSVRKIIANHSPDVIKNDMELGLTLFETNPKLDEKQNITSWLSFSEPVNIPKEYRNIKYRLIVKDNKNIEATHEIYLISAYDKNIS